MPRTAADGYPSKMDDMDKDDQGYVEVSFKARSDGIFSLLELLQHCETVGGYGHSFGIVIDPDDSEYRNTVGFDGDGSDAVTDIKVNGRKVTRDLLKFDKPKKARVAAVLLRLARELLGSDGDDFKEGEQVLVGALRFEDDALFDLYRQAVVVSQPDEGSVTVRYKDGTEETLDKDEVSYPKNVSFSF